jgi:hypothetical protein
MAFNGDAALPLQLHIVENLVLEITLCNGVGVHKHPVGQSAFPVINVSNNAEVSDVLHL